MVENPFRNIQLKNWPDFWLAITGIAFVVVLTGLVAGQQLPGGSATWVMLFGGFVMFGIGAQKAHYKAHLKGVEGNINVWVSKWRHSLLADLFAVIGVLLVLCAVVLFLGWSWPNTALNPTGVPLRSTPSG